MKNVWHHQHGLNIILYIFVVKIINFYEVRQSRVWITFLNTKIQKNSRLFESVQSCSKVTVEWHPLDCDFSMNCISHRICIWKVSLKSAYKKIKTRKLKLKHIIFVDNSCFESGFNFISANVNVENENSLRFSLFCELCCALKKIYKTRPRGERS